ncbi:hypothetical protein F66182_1458 [Fusarium sp. NRRL 66182]|nr:hypothetical protein F66182_1458 [Fusarium sp. NRRL 66182]
MAQTYAGTLDDKCFRLASVTLERHPDSGEQVPSITLSTHDLSGAAEIGYNALSYTWGSPRHDATDSDPDTKTSILFNGEIFKVQPNLYNALLELHTSCVDTLVWIDALCINQSDPTERSAQVSVMNQIYGKATRVIVWLGEAFPELEAGLRAAERIGAESVPQTLRMLGTQTWDFVSDVSSMRERYSMEPIDRDEAIGLVTLLTSNWLARIWVIQEVALARDVVVLCNGRFTSFDCVGLTATFLHYSGLYQAVIYLLPKEKLHVHIRYDINIFQAERLQLLREWCKGEKSPWAGVLSTIDFEAGLENQQQNSSPMLLLRLLFSTFGFRVTDSRDCIYGLVGILKHMAAEQGYQLPLEFEPNYEVETKDLLQDVARKIIHTTDSLVYLSLVKDLSYRQTPGLPSWAPDFPPVMHNSLHGPQFRSIGTVNASKHVPRAENKHSFNISGGTLHAFGFPLGSVANIGEDYVQSLQGHFDKLADILLSMDLIYSYTKQPADEVLWRTLIWDSDSTYRPSQLIRIQDFQRAVLEQIITALKGQYLSEEEKSVGQAQVSSSIDNMGYLDCIADKFPSSIFPDVRLVKSICVKLGYMASQEGDDLLDSEELESLEKALSQNSMPPTGLMASFWHGRKPFVTDTGYLSMGFTSAEIGDEAWIVSGSPAPLVLRRTGEEKNEYTLIGEAYVHGAMQGEAVTDDVVWEKIQIV